MKRFVVSASALGLILAVFYAHVRAEDPNRAVAPVVRASALEIVNEQGRTVGRIGACPQGFPGIAIALGDSPLAAISIMALPDGSVTLQLNDQRAEARWLLGLHADGRSELHISKSDTTYKQILEIDAKGKAILRADDVRESQGE